MAIVRNSNSFLTSPPSSPRFKRRLTMSGLSWKWMIFSSLVCGTFLFLCVNVYYFNVATSTIINNETNLIENCKWKDGDPILFKIVTKSGVNYEGGHWFHIAENFMVQHSILRHQNKLANSSKVHNIEENIPTEKRFVIKDKDSTSKGTLGGEWPTPQRGHWFPHDGDIHTFRQKIMKLCPLKEDLLASKITKYSMVIYQRDRSRKLLEQSSVIKELQHQLGSEWKIS
eukprot:gene12370-26022_t